MTTTDTTPPAPPASTASIATPAGTALDRSASARASYVGSRVRRKEDNRLLRGEGHFGHDVQRPRMLHARVVRSSSAHGRITAIDVSEARDLPGVIDVVTGNDLHRRLHIPVRLNVQGVDLTDHLQPILPTDEVHYVGEPLAVVLAEDAYIAEDAAELIIVEIDELPVVLEATSLGADVTVAADFTMSYGEVDQAFEKAEHITELTFDIGRHSAVPMEPRTLVADPVGDGSLDIFGATKVPVFNRSVLAALLETDVEKIRMHATDAGGGFGVRGEFYPEDFLIPWLALRTSRPVSWAEDRGEHMVAVNHSRQQRHRLSLALKKSGEILGLRADVVHDNGAYARTHGIIVPELTIAMLPGPYRIPAYDARVRVALSHKTPCGTYRGPGRFEGTASREQLLDKAAAELGIDRIELRRANLLTRSELPHARDLGTLGTDMLIDDGDFGGLFQSALDRAVELGWMQQVQQRRSEGAIAGLGVAMFMEKSGLGPTDTADAQITSTGRLRIYSGGTSLGQGIETALAQIAADAMGIDIDQVDVINGDTAQQPFGTGSWASRSTVVAGNAVRAACNELGVRLITLASRALGLNEADLVIDQNGVRHRQDAARSCSFADLARHAAPGSPHLRADESAGLRQRSRFVVDHMTYPYGAHICLIEIDRGTGAPRVLGYLVAYEVGVAVNPLMIEGQLYGGIAQGIGGALLEEFRYDESGQPQSATFMDYLMPTACEIPDMDLIVLADHPASTNPLGVRGAGEGGVTAAGGCLASAVRDALAHVDDVDPEILRLPITPSFIRGRLR